MPGNGTTSSAVLLSEPGQKQRTNFQLGSLSQAAKKIESLYVEARHGLGIQGESVPCEEHRVSVKCAIPDDFRARNA